MTLHITLAAPHELPDCLAIRRTVFVEEQAVPEALEVDGLDDEAIHYLGRLNDRPIATARVRIVDGVSKVQRVAVLHDERGKGAGAAIMRAIMVDDALPRAFTLGSQQSAVGFYERLGFRVVGEPFMDAGIPHLTMVYP